MKWIIEHAELTKCIQLFAGRGNLADAQALSLIVDLLY